MALVHSCSISLDSFHESAFFRSSTEAMLPVLDLHSMYIACVESVSEGRTGYDCSEFAFCRSGWAIAIVRVCIVIHKR